MKQRPRGVVYDQPDSISGLNDVENERKSRPVRCSRSGAFVNDHITSRSSQEKRTLIVLKSDLFVIISFLSIDYRIDSLSSHPSSISDDGYGHISPIGDLDLGLEEITNEPSDPPAILDKAPASAVSTVALTPTPAGPDLDSSEVKSARDEEQPADNTQNQLNRNFSSSSWKPKASLRKKLHVSSSKPSRFAVSANENNSNNHRPTSARRSKPRTLGLTNSIKEARKKFSVRDGVASPTIKSVRKKLLSPVSYSLF